MLLVSDREDAQGLPRIVGRERLYVCSISEATGAEDEIVVVDVDLEDHQKRKYLKRLFREARPRRALAVAIDSSSMRFRQAARALGATTLLSRPVTAGMLNRFIEGIERGRDPAPLARAMSQGVTVLADAFEAQRSRQKLDLAAIRIAAADIADAVADCGAKAWMEAVAAAQGGAFRNCLANAGLVGAFGQRIGLNGKDVTLLTMAGLLADLGAASLPVSLSDRTGPLTDRETALVRRHPLDTHDYLSACSGLPDAVLCAIRHHHELLDGSGYPDAIKAERINDLARVLCVCDLFAELVDERRHDPALDAKDAFDVLRVMVRENKIEAGPVGVLEMAYFG